MFKSKIEVLHWIDRRKKRIFHPKSRYLSIRIVCLFFIQTSVILKKFEKIPTFLKIFTLFKGPNKKWHIPLERTKKNTHFTLNIGVSTYKNRVSLHDRKIEKLKKSGIISTFWSVFIFFKAPFKKWG